ncbi:MAG: Three-deoxy-D-manno-octulosonic-acid transferase protein [Acidobacteriaceae bacterium]|nr:Three-deoxy-D-manno-octulosonic-acid transferase protein [Acidobacteriaceae bacterium]
MVMVVGAPYWLARMMTSGRYRAGLAGRLGQVPAEVQAAGDSVAQEGRALVWIHAVSVGEVLAATALVGELREAGLAVTVSTTTQAGQELARRRFTGCAVFYMPLDLGILVRRYLQALRPKLVVTMESELWPNVIRECRKAGIPLAVVNARVSDRSFPRYMKLRRVWGPLLREVRVFLAQSEETAGRLRRMGVESERVRMTGNLKFDVRAVQMTEMTRRIKSLLGNSPLVVAGSTLAGEEEVLLAAWPTVLKTVPDAILLIAPRHTDRFEDVLALIQKSGSPCLLCSTVLKQESSVNPELSGSGTIVLLDTIGDLASMYSLGSVAFVGGSVVAKGGHNPLEPAQFGVPVVMGPSYQNFKEIVGAMKDAGAIRIVERDALGEALVELMTDRASAESMGQRGKAVFEAQAGATGRTVSALMELVGMRLVGVRRA